MKTMERKLFPYLMLLPMVIIFGVFLFVPAINGFLISFTKWDGVNPQEFVGLHNYVKLMGDKMILSILVYTFFSRMFDLMLPPVAKHSIVVA